jgi:hypothetical protein
VTLAGENTTEVYGDQGVIIQNHDDLVQPTSRCRRTRLRSSSTRAAIASGKTWASRFPASHAERIAAVPRAFVNCVKCRICEPPTTAHDGRVSVEMVLGAYQFGA